MACSWVAAQWPTGTGPAIVVRAIMDGHRYVLKSAEIVGVLAGARSLAERELEILQARAGIEAIWMDMECTNTGGRVSSVMRTR